jgi:hypothetical protein
MSQPIDLLTFRQKLADAILNDTVDQVDLTSMCSLDDDEFDDAFALIQSLSTLFLAIARPLFDRAYQVHRNNIAQLRRDAVELVRLMKAVNERGEFGDLYEECDNLLWALLDSLLDNSLAPAYELPLAGDLVLHPDGILHLPDRTVLQKTDFDVDGGVQLGDVIIRGRVYHWMDLAEGLLAALPVMIDAGAISDVVES